MNSFVNNQQYIKNIPTVGDISMESIEGKQLYVRLFNLTILGLLLGGIYVALHYSEIDIFTDYGYIVALVIALLFAIIVVLNILAFYKIKYAIRDKDIIYQKGLIWRTTTIVPFNRVQHCEVRQGLIQRYFGLASLKLFTAGGSSSDLSIQGLSHENAEKLRDFIIKKTGVDEEE